MKTKQLEIGAPSLSGKGASEVDEAIRGMEFPCSLVVENRMPRAAVFPESGVELASTLASSGQVAEVKFASAAALRRLLRTAAEVADLNGFPVALIVSEVAPATLDEELTQQVVDAAPELADEVAAGGGVDAAATLADGETADTNAAPEGEGDAPADGANTNTETDGNSAGDEAPATGDAPAAETEKPTRKAGGKRSQK